ncbi:hypothetical protein [Candidatus Uabimicrobium sp. HlEnr_7]|uniref:hypothetical protein n=1 Tax=Candidatus Uabimicrobium helgolandensis TaxID=3095367 RepID=UPI00355899D7
MKKNIIFILMMFLVSFLYSDRIKDADIRKAIEDIPKKKLPKVLTKKNWKKNKGFWAKVFKKKTGITDKLDALEDAFELIADDKRGDLYYPNVFDPSIQNASDFNKQYKKSYKAWANLADLKDKAKDLREAAESVEEDFKKSKKIPKKSTKHAKKVKEAAGKLYDALKDAKPKKWRKKFKAEKKKSLTVIKAIDDLKEEGLNNPLKVMLAVGVLDVTFNGELEDICDSYEKDIVPQLEELRNDPQALASKFNAIVVAQDNGSRRISNNTGNISTWNQQFNIDFIYPTDTIDDAMAAFNDWGGNKRSATAQNAVAELDDYIEYLGDLKAWAVKYSKKWKKDKAQ